MSQTVLTSATAYCSAAEFLNRYDRRTVAKLCSDTGEAIVDGALEANTNLAAALAQASGRVESASLVGERYTPTDLASLTGNAAAHLAGIVADLAYPILARRRPKENVEVPPQAKEAEEWLEALARGMRIFGFAEAAEAGHMDSSTETRQIVENRKLWTYTAERMFGTRNNRLYG